MRCKHKTKKRLTCGNDLGDASQRNVGEVVVCKGCLQVTVVNQGHILADTMKKNAEFMKSIGRQPPPQPQFLTHYCR